MITVEKYEEISDAMLFRSTRLGALFQVIHQWDGYVSAAVYLTKPQISALAHNISSQPNKLLDKTSIHVVIDDGVSSLSVFIPCAQGFYCLGLIFVL